MKWFKHYTKALSDAKIEKLIMRYGVEGYGLYFACLELIAGNITDDNITFELEHDSEILAHKFKVDTIKIEEMMKYMCSLNLFELNETNNKIICLKLAKNLDSSLIKNPKLLEIKKIIQENSRKSEKMPARLDKIRLEKNSSTLIPSLAQIKDYIIEKQLKYVDADIFYNYYSKRDWKKANNKQVLNWKNTVLDWEDRESKNTDKPKVTYLSADEKAAQTKRELEKYQHA